MDNMVQQEISSFLGRIFRKNFGKGPELIYVSIRYSFISIYLKNFLSHMETVLLELDQEVTVRELRESIMQKLIPEIQSYIQSLTGTEVTEFYFDWDLQRKSGIILGISPKPFDQCDSKPSENDNQSQLDQQLLRMIQHTYKEPDPIDTYQMNDRTILVIRHGKWLAIERELIRLGNEKIVGMAKKNMDRAMIQTSGLESVLGSKIDDFYVIWNAALNQSIFIIILEGPGKQSYVKS